MSPQYETDKESLEQACEVEFYRASGPGGQHRNRRETAVRLTHRAAGIVVTASERRSQAQNLEVAFERMAERLKKKNRKRKPRIKTRPSGRQRAKRLEAKRKIGNKKKLRKPPDHGE